MIKPKCVKCRKELTEMGAVVLSPPHHDAITTPLLAIVTKMHVCVECFALLTAWLKGEQLELDEEEQLRFGI